MQVFTHLHPSQVWEYSALDWWGKQGEGGGRLHALWGLHSISTPPLQSTKYTKTNHTQRDKNFLRKGMQYLQAIVALAEETYNVKLLVSHILILSVYGLQKLQSSNLEGKMPLIFLKIRYWLRSKEWFKQQEAHPVIGQEIGGGSGGNFGKYSSGLVDQYRDF